MATMHSSFAGSKGNRNLTIVASYDAPASPDFLFAEYRRAHAHWHVTKSEVDRKAVREVYERFGVAFCGDAEFIAAEAARIWGVATCR